MASLYKKRGFYYIDFWMGKKRKTINTDLKITTRNYLQACKMKKQIEEEIEIKKSEIEKRSYEVPVKDHHLKPNQKLLLSSLISKYKIKISLRSDSHQELFKIVFMHFTNIVPADTDITEITPEHIIMFIKSIQDKVQNATLITYLNYLKGFFNYLVDEDYLSKSPIRKKDCPRRQRKSIVTFKDEMLEQILKEAYERDYTFYCVLRLLRLTGIRPVDLLRLKKGDFDFKNRIINVVISKTKKEIKFPIYQELYDFLRDEMKGLSELHDDERIFEGFTVRIVGKRFRSIKIKLGIKDKYTFTLKTFRKTFATDHAKKLDIQDVAYLLGHDETDTTRTFYADVIVDNLRNKMDNNNNK